MADLEALDDLVARALVDGHLVAEQDPVPVVGCVVLEQLAVEGGGVLVDDEEDLRVRVVVRPRPGEEVVELKAADGGHGEARYYPIGVRTLHPAELGQLTPDL